MSFSRLQSSLYTFVYSVNILIEGDMLNDLSLNRNSMRPRIVPEARASHHHALWAVFQSVCQAHHLEKSEKFGKVPK